MEINYNFYQYESAALLALWDQVGSGSFEKEISQELAALEKELKALKKHPNVLLDQNNPDLIYSDKARYDQISVTLLKHQQLQGDFDRLRGILVSVQELRQEIIGRQDPLSVLASLALFEQDLVRRQAKAVYFAQEGYWLEQFLGNLFRIILNQEIVDLLQIKHGQWLSLYKGYTKEYFKEALALMFRDNPGHADDASWIEKVIAEDLRGIRDVLKSSLDTKSDIIVYGYWDDSELAFLDVPQNKQRLESIYRKLTDRWLSN